GPLSPCRPAGGEAPTGTAESLRGGERVHRQVGSLLGDALELRQRGLRCRAVDEGAAMRAHCCGNGFYHYRSVLSSLGGAGRKLPIGRMLHNRFGGAQAQNTPPRSSGSTVPPLCPNRPWEVSPCPPRHLGRPQCNEPSAN